VVIRVELDNLNTHTPAPLYEAFEPEEACRILHKSEFHYTPKHGSWLNMAEIEIWSNTTKYNQINPVGCIELKT